MAPKVRPITKESHRTRRRSAFTSVPAARVILANPRLRLFAFSCRRIAKVRGPTRGGRALENLKQMCPRQRSHLHRRQQRRPAARRGRQQLLRRVQDRCRTSNRATSTTASSSTSLSRTRPTPTPARSVIKTFLSPRDPAQEVRDDSGATNYLVQRSAVLPQLKANHPAKVSPTARATPSPSARR